MEQPTGTDVSAVYAAMRTMQDEMGQQKTPKKVGDALAGWNPGVVVSLAALVFIGSLVGFDASAPSFLDPSLHFNWAVTSALTITVAVILFFPTLARRRKQNAEFSEPPGLGGIWWGSKERLNIITPFVFALVGSAAGLGFRLDWSEESLWSLPTVVSWIVPLVAMISLLDVHSIATNGAAQFVMTTWEGVKSVNRLRSHLDNYLSVLAAQIAAWVLFFAVTRESNVVLAYGGFLTGLLALIYLPTALAVDRLASTMVEVRTKSLDWGTDFLASRQLRDAYRRELGLDQTLRERFEKGFYVGAPLATALFSSFVNVG